MIHEAKLVRIDGEQCACCDPSFVYVRVDSFDDDKPDMNDENQFVCSSGVEKYSDAEGLPDRLILGVARLGEEEDLYAHCAILTADGRILMEDNDDYGSYKSEDMHTALHNFLEVECGIKSGEELYFSFTGPCGD